MLLPPLPSAGNAGLCHYTLLAGLKPKAFCVLDKLPGNCITSLATVLRP